MRTTWIAALVAAAALGAGLAVACGGGSSDEGQVKAGLAREVKALRNEDWRTLYSMLSPRARQGCNASDFADAMKSVSNVDFSKLDVRDVVVTVNGRSADVTYATVYDGDEVDRTTRDDPEIWVKVDGRWYDDNKGKSDACDFSA